MKIMVRRWIDLIVSCHISKKQHPFSGYPGLAIFPKKADILSDLVYSLGKMLHTSKLSSLKFLHKCEV